MMKRFIAKVSIFTGTVFIILFGLISFSCFVCGNQYATGYMGALSDKVERLESIKEPKIILVGHSNLAFGVCSDMIEEEFDMPVVNLGLHGGLGNAFHEDMAKLNINEGDIVVLCHSSFSGDDSIPDIRLAWTGLEWNFNTWRIINENNRAQIVTAFPYYLYQNILRYIMVRGNEETKAPYSRNAFNEFGDVVVKPDEGKKETDEIFFEGCEVKVPLISDDSIERINNFNNYVEERNATLLVAGYPIAEGEFTPTVEAYNIFENELREKLDCEVISHYSEYFIPYEYFYDTVLHLTNSGAVIRTNQLIEDLKTWMIND